MSPLESDLTDEPEVSRMSPLESDLTDEPERCRMEPSVAPEPMAAGLTMTKRPDGVAVITFDTPDSPVNVLSRSFFAAFAQLLDSVGRDGEIKACVLASAKPDGFIAGADLKEILAMATPEEGEALSRDGHALLDRMAASAKPFVAAIHGPALGGGLEVALACHYRLASDDPKTVLALPEVMLGLLPGGGGTQRLPRLIGLPRALPMLLTGQRLRAKQARRAGLVDALCGPYGLVDTAARAALALANGTLTRSAGPRGPMATMLKLAPARAFLLDRARTEVQAKTRGLYPAPLAILDCVQVGMERGLEAGLAFESKRFGRLVAGVEAKHMIRLFNAINGLKAEGRSPSAGPDAVPAIRHLAVIGAGLMGQGIAAVSIGQTPVTLNDVGPDALAKAAKALYEGLAKRLKSGALTPLERDRQWAQLRFTSDYADLRSADLVIEAVFEKLELKQHVLAATEAVLAADAVFASNTSALPIRAIAEGARHPERVLGMHYFSPVTKMPLLELVVTPQTAPRAIATARAYGQAQGKTVIVVQDGPGFYTTRILAPFLGESIRLLEEGAAIRHIDRAARDFGFPMGPLALMDEIGLDVGAHVARDLGAAFSDRGMASSDALARLVEAGLTGRKGGQGFYLYPRRRPPGRKPVNPAAYAVFGGVSRKGPSLFPEAAIVERLVLLLVNEAVLCLQEGVIACARDGDVGAILGLGFPPFRGGPFRYVDDLGAAAIVTRLNELSQTHGERFRPAAHLVTLAATGKCFYEL